MLKFNAVSPYCFPLFLQIMSWALQFWRVLTNTVDAVVIGRIPGLWIIHLHGEMCVADSFCLLFTVDYKFQQITVVFNSEDREVTLNTDRCVVRWWIAQYPEWTSSTLCVVLVLSINFYFQPVYWILSAKYRIGRASDYCFFTMLTQIR